MNNPIMVSVVCNTYNHERYIERCLQGLVMQETNFKFEILIHDDASTDKTADIIRSYEAQYPDLIKPIYQKENQYSKGGIYLFQYPRVQGKYIALCEGDDYWTDEMKLQRQFDALEAHPEVDICAHGATIISEEGTKELGKITPRSKMTTIPIEAVIYGGGAFVATNSLMYRATLKTTEYEFRNMWRIDYTLQILGSLQGGMLYLPEVMSCYRWCADGSWTARQNASREKRKATFEKMKQALQCLDRETEHKYHTVIEQTILRDEFIFYYMYGPYKMALSEKFERIRKKKGLMTTVKIYVKMIKSFFSRRK